MTTSHHDKHAPFRWGKWQEYYRGKETLPPAAAAQGYTLLKVRRSLRPAFFAVVDLLRARVRFEDQLPRLLQDAAVVETLPQVQDAWQAWATWTRRLAASVERVARGKDGTVPPVPEALLRLLDEEESDGA